MTKDKTVLGFTFERGQQYGILCVKSNYRVCRVNEEKECFSFSCDVMFEINLCLKLLWRHFERTDDLMHLS